MSEIIEPTSERNRLITIAIGLIVLAIFVSVAYRLPEAYRAVIGYLCVGDIIKLVLLFIMLGMVLSARPPLAAVAIYYCHQGFGTRKHPERMLAATSMSSLGGEIANVIIIAILWPIVVKIVNILLLMDVERSFSWVSIVVTVAFVAILLWRLYLMYQSLKVVLDVIGAPKAKLSCPKCGALNLPTAKFCTSCGAELRPAVAEESAQSLLCPKCGIGNKPGSKFCENCGEPLSKT